MPLFNVYEFSKKYIWQQFIKNGFTNITKVTTDYNIQYWDNNKSGDIIMLVHGFGAQAEFQWYKQIKKLSQKYRVIIPNLLYFGDTYPLLSEKYDLQDQVDLVNTLVTHLKIEKFILLGISYGGLVSVEYSNQNIDKVAKLIIVNSPIKYFNQNDINRICVIYKLNTIDELFAPNNYKGLVKQFNAAYYGKQLIPNFIFKQLYQNLCFPNIENWKNLILQLNLQLTRYSEQDYLLDCPILLIWGEKDDIIPLRVAEELEGHFKNSELKIIKMTKHLPNIEKASRFNKILLNFLQDLKN